MSRFVFLLASLLSVGFAVPAAAQPAAYAPPARSWHWGVTASVAPWRAGDMFKSLYEAQTLDFAGNEIRAGITRGSTRRGEWAITYVRKTITEGSTFVTAIGHRYQLGPRVVLSGVMAEQFAPLATIRRTQIGVVLAAGAGRVEGKATLSSTGEESNVRDVLTIFARPQPYHPLGRCELAVAVATAPGMKMRFSGGFDWPGSTRLSVTAMYFFNDDD
jgi:hypothetical protein